MTTARPAALVAYSPGYYIRQRLWRNKPAMAGLVFIALASLVAVLGYLIMPDDSPDANHTIVQLQKKPPGFSVTVLRIPAGGQPVAETSLLSKMLFGQARSYTEFPISSYALAGDLVRVEPYEQNAALPGADPVFKLRQLTGIRDREAAKRYLEQEAIYRKTFWLGTDNAGRDVLSRLMLGTRISLGIGLVAVLISLVLGIAVGAAAGYFGGLTDKAMLWLMTVVWSVPGIMLVIAISLALNSQGIWVSFVAVGLTMWVEVARVVRGQFLSLKEMTYIEAAKVLGLPRYRIVLKHFLPNMSGSLIVIATANFASAILMEAGLSFLGLGVQPPSPSWGMMVNEGFQLIGARASLFLVLSPSVCISLLVLSFNLLGNGLRDAYDPKILLTHSTN
jgi:ABC-type dipeptide/oligopeptide/nickel transport system permease subunit